MHVAYVMALKSGEMTMKAISEKLNMDKANTTRAMVFLREAGLITDDRESENSRKYNIFLTEKGQSLARALKRSMDEAFAVYTKGLSEDEIGAIIAVLEKVRKNIDPEGKLLSAPTVSDDQCPDC
jgi:DNA-binding MarR family transcriptional regulator